MRRQQFILVTALSALSSLGVGLLGPVYAIFVVDSFSANLIDVGLLCLVFSLVTAIFRAPAGKLVDSFGKERILLAGIITGVACSLSYILASNLTQLYVIESVFGLSCALNRQGLLAFAMDASDKNNSGLSFGLFESANDIATAIAALLAAIIVTALGFRYLFLTCSGCQVATGFLMINKVPNRKLKEEQSFS